MGERQKRRDLGRPVPPMLIRFREELARERKEARRQRREARKERWVGRWARATRWLAGKWNGLSRRRPRG